MAIKVDRMCELAYSQLRKYQNLHEVSNQTPIYTMITNFKIYHIEFDYYTSSQENNK